MNTRELIKYLETFEQDREVDISICNLDKDSNVISSDSWEIQKNNICINVYHDGAVIEILLDTKLKEILNL